MCHLLLTARLLFCLALCHFLGTARFRFRLATSFFFCAALCHLLLTARLLFCLALCHFLGAAHFRFRLATSFFFCTALCLLLLAARLLRRLALCHFLGTAGCFLLLLLHGGGFGLLANAFGFSGLCLLCCHLFSGRTLLRRLLLLLLLLLHGRGLRLFVLCLLGSLHVGFFGLYGRSLLPSIHLFSSGTLLRCQVFRLLARCFNHRCIGCHFFDLSRLWSRRFDRDWRNGWSDSGRRFNSNHRSRLRRWCWHHHCRRSQLLRLREYPNRRAGVRLRFGLVPAWAWWTCLYHWRCGHGRFRRFVTDGDGGTHGFLRRRWHNNRRRYWRRLMGGRRRCFRHDRQLLHHSSGFFFGNRLTNLLRHTLRHAFKGIDTLWLIDAIYDLRAHWPCPLFFGGQFDDDRLRRLFAAMPAACMRNLIHCD